MKVDLLHLIRSLRRSPASAAAAVLTLTLTIGAGGSVFAIVDGVLLTPPPFAKPDALVTVGEKPLADAAGPPRTVRYATLDAWRERAASLATLEGMDGTNVTLTGLGPIRRLSVNDVTTGFLATLGVAPSLGRLFNPDDAGRAVVILSHAFWRDSAGSNPRIVGESIVLGGRTHTIVGVLPERFRYELNPADLWRPLPGPATQEARQGLRVGVIARRASDVSAADLAAALDDVSRDGAPPARAVVTPIALAISGGTTRMLSLLAGAAALAALIAFVNLAGLLIVRSLDRRRELMVRATLGARPFEIARQLLLEGQFLVALGTIGGVLIALWATPAIAREVLAQFGGIAGRPLAANWRIAAFVAVTASACAWIVTGLPALAAARRTALGGLARNVTPPRRGGLRRALIAAEVALAFVLLACVTLLGASLLRLLDVNPGFESRGVLALQVSVPAARYGEPRVLSFYSTLQSALDARIGPRSVAVINEIPLTGNRGRSLVSHGPDDSGPEAVVREAGPAYFDVMRIPIVAGRAFDARDTASAPPRVVISESLAARLFPDTLPIGRQVWLQAAAQMAEVIGVAGDVKHLALEEPLMPTVYLSAMREPSRSRVLVVRSPRENADVIAIVRGELARLDADIPVYGVRSMDEIVAASPGMPARRVLTATFAGFALLALVLAAIGLFGVMTHDVASRRTELAVRLALGAAPRRILSTTLGDGAVLVAAGLSAGGLLSIRAGQALASSGFAGGLHAWSIAVPAATLIACGAAAVLPAARRAARVDPAAVLRGD